MSEKRKVLIADTAWIEPHAVNQLRELGFTVVLTRGIDSIRTVDDASDLRDQMAMAALQKIDVWSFGADIETLPKYAANVALTAYVIADAMLAARSAKGEK